mmetsp:Transcript_55446/g.160686  ORF Transcript_55446/g.160686 Transcript_55446/m.160686 type:complete len:234 (+) Transcript_55446:856-1557(+)
MSIVAAKPGSDNRTTIESATPSEKAAIRRSNATALGDRASSRRDAPDRALMSSSSNNPRMKPNRTSSTRVPRCTATSSLSRSTAVSPKADTFEALCLMTSSATAEWRTAAMASAGMQDASSTYSPMRQRNPPTAEYPDAQSIPQSPPLATGRPSQPVALVCGPISSTDSGLHACGVHGATLEVRQRPPASQTADQLVVPIPGLHRTPQTAPANQPYPRGGHSTSAAPSGSSGG